MVKLSQPARARAKVLPGSVSPQSEEVCGSLQVCGLAGGPWVLVKMQLLQMVLRNLAMVPEARSMDLAWEGLQCTNGRHFSSKGN